MSSRKVPSSLIAGNWAALLPALAAGLLYFATTCRSLWIGDSSEFALALYSTGVAHPPGYPLFTIVGTIFVQALEFLRPITAGGLYNLFLAAAGVGVVYLVAARFHGKIQALGLALMWAVTPIFWAETAGVEIYALNVLLFAVVLLAIFSKPNNRWLSIAYLFGLSLSNHPSALSLGAGLIFLFIAEKRYKQPVYLIPMAALTLLAGTIYFYLYAASLKDPVSDWGNPETLSALWAHMQLEQYSGWVENSLQNLWYAVKLYIRAIVECYTYAGVLLCASGIAAGFIRRRRETIFLLLVLAAALVLAAFHQAVNHEPFYLIPLLITLLLIGFNLDWLKNELLFRVLSGAALIMIAVVLAVVHYDDQDKSDYVLYEEYCESMLDALPPNSILFTAGDINAFGPTYLRYAEGYRPDVTIYDRSIRRDALFQRAHELGGEISDLYIARGILLYIENRRKFLAKNHYQHEPEWWANLDSLNSYGLHYEFGTPSDEPPPVLRYPGDYDPGDLMSRELLANLDLIRGEVALLAQPPDTTEAREAFVTAMKRYENEDRGVLFNQLGIFYRRMGFSDLSLEAYERGLEQPILAKQNRDEMLYNMSNVYKERANEALAEKDLDAALRNSLKALEYDPINERLLLNVALMYDRELGQPEAAVPYYERYLELEPDDDRVREALEALK